MNPLHKGTDTITFTEGNLKSSFTSDTDDTHHGCTFALPKEGKWYWEQTFTGADTGGSQAPYCGIYDSDTLALGISDNLFTTSGDFITYYTHNNAIYISGSSTNYTGSIGNQSGAVVGFAVDMDGGHCWVHVNGTYINGTPTFSDGTNKVASPNTDSTYIPFWSGNGGGSMTWEANFGQASFTGTIPTGYSKLTSANLPEPTISPNADTQADDYFDTFLFYISQAVQHELIHKYQWFMREYDTSEPQKYKSKEKDPKIRQAQEYLGHTDEIDARANDLWLEIKHAKKDINCLASLKDLVKDSDTLTGYIATFGDSDHKVVKRLLTRTWKYAKAV